MTIDIEEWHPSSEIPTSPQAFPRAGVNSLASLEARGAARLLDLVLLAIPYFGIVGLVLILSGDGEASTAESEPSTAAWMAIVAPLIGLLMVYETICVTRWGQTLGKLVLGVRVARQVNGRCPLWWEAALRIGIFGVVAVIPHGLAVVVAPSLYLVAGFDPMRRNVPDRAAGTVVVRSR